MPADALGTQATSPTAGAPASACWAPSKPRSAADHRKPSKPVMEKRRRARINDSLAQLKSLLLDALKRDSERHSKLEKADILEMTVRHLQDLRRVQVAAALRANPAVLSKYRAGFLECLAEVTRFLAGCEGVPADVRSRLLGHLAACLGQLGCARRPAPSAPSAPALPARRAQLSARRGPACALPLRSRRTGPPPATPRAGPQSRDAPWRPWLR